MSALGARPATFEAALATAFLWAGPDAAAAGSSAARIWGLERSGRIEIVVANARRLRLSGVVVRRSLRLDPRREVGRRHGFPLTTVRRTLLDVCAHGSREQATDCVDEAIRLRLTSPDRLLAGLEAGRPGAARLGQLARELEARTDSAFERRALALIRRFGLPEPERQRPFTCDGRGLRADFAWPAARLVLECDGFAFHRTRHDLARDRWRRRAFAALGQDVVWITWDDVRDPAAFAPVAADLARRLGDRGAVAA